MKNSSITRIEHPIKMYIRRDLGITVEQFGKIAGFPQSTLATWIKRDRRVEKLPIVFYSALATVAGKKIETIYQELLSWQQRSDRYRQASLQAVNDEKPLFSLAAEEGSTVYQLYRRENRTTTLLPLAKRLRKAIDQQDSATFIQAIIEIYSEIELPLPSWFAAILKKPEKVKEAGQAFYNELLMKG